jgi:hypothetical protein
LCRHCPVRDPGELVIELTIGIRFNRGQTNQEVARSYFREWNEWSIAKRSAYLQKISAARQAAEIAEMEAEFWG